MDLPLNTNCFREDLLRSYLGRYESRFRSNPSRHGVIMHTDPYPVLVVQLSNALILLAEYIEIEKDDPYYGAFDYYQIDIITVSVGDPSGAKKVETAIAKSFLAGTQFS